MDASPCIWIARVTFFCSTVYHIGRAINTQMTKQNDNVGNFGIFRGRRGMKNFQRQGRNFLGVGESKFSGSGRGELKIATQI